MSLNHLVELPVYWSTYPFIGRCQMIIISLPTDVVSGSQLVAHVRL